MLDEILGSATDRDHVRGAGREVDAEVLAHISPARGMCRRRFPFMWSATGTPLCLCGCCAEAHGHGEPAGAAPAGPDLGDQYSEGDGGCGGCATGCS